MTVGSMPIAGQQSLNMGDIGDFSLQTAKDGLSLEFLLNGDTAVRTGRVLFVPAFAAGLAGDYNSDGRVNAADYTVWRNHRNTATALANDDTPGVGNDDFTRWKNNFGNVGPGSGGSGLAASSVPEPGAGWLARFGLSAVFLVSNGWRGSFGWCRFGERSAGAFLAIQEAMR